MEEKLQKIKEIAQREMKEAESAHDFLHVMRVYNLCLHLAKTDPDVDLEILKAAIFLHDIARVKEDSDASGKIDHAIFSAKMAQKILRNLDYPEEKIKQIEHCIVAHRFRSGNEPQTKEAKILFDADKLDVLGTIGIARSYTMAGRYGEKMYLDVSIAQYVKENLVGGKEGGRIKVISKHAPNLEYELKFKRIPDRLYTKEAKRIARDRLKFMDQFYKRFKKEMAGEK
ncbi:MAG: phosphohydrolase [Parcubacteria group bacterium CG1_02_40_82]|uniref:Phosphohydrolase n=4 Tax=Candidatus Portnoyibacteriota TaxID=1817913 RepID=A0A2M7IHC5_9BACT|nr:MAG: phosphohydrolase [Parcubacteria group bacterium CG1_02_40_82]PIQ74869.1 MAG: phosphohydrolase [Candidatus Portnoybacteria bacterium CG11_big_fil_rev_8_21_14_0_20_40_15]PIS31049.1 MAG: phosphohydrolase [Candidatus Portnoybacteria bacterium CG08_land_8_20_14_0_20_40_83]PIW75895.1 MAG: phosphohydrolase [Candidatus Portnoybacteria bacterium CG_4_8_14_3_um_filter_40_10]PIY73999.1 MAG: phosphohydrolase [Candidatus Portnoybacteria bacterium CG_4_10_14_0_8_um_filter_40_50]PJA64337.1 MAG: phosp